MKAKRKLSELKENECVLMSTLKDVIGVFKHVQFNCKKQELVGKYIHRNVDYDHAYNWSHMNDGKIVIPASDFIKPKKSKLKEVYQEIARLDGEVEQLKEVINDYDKRFSILESNRNISLDVFKLLDKQSQDNFKNGLDRIDNIKKEEIKTASDEIDWSKPMFIESIRIDKTVLLSTGLGSTKDYPSFTGIVVKTSNPNIWSIGEYSTTWAQSEFRPFKGEIKLSND